MMVQDAPAGEPHFITSMIEHNDFCEQFGRAFGNVRFQRPEPFEPVIFVIGNHDRGWDEWDANPGFDAKTGLPCGLTNTPIPVAIQTNRGSPDFNEKHHPYSGLLSSMHSWGLYHARYGFSEFRVRAGGSVSVPIFPQFADQTNAMLEAEHARQERIKTKLGRDPATPRHADPLFPPASSDLTNGREVRARAGRCRRRCRGAVAAARQQHLLDEPVPV